MTPLANWATFYEVLGSASAALTGLQFITMALLADTPIRSTDEAEAGDAFATPTMVHFAIALFLAAAGAAPWATLVIPAVLWGLSGAAGFLYTLVVLRRMRSQRAYRPVLEDWLFHAVFPLLAYAVLIAGMPLALAGTPSAPIAVAAAALLLLFIGVHNAWDNVIYIAFRKRMQNSPQSPEQRPPHRDS